MKLFERFDVVRRAEGVAFYRGVDLIKPLNTKLYTVSGFKRKILYMLYCTFFSFSLKQESFGSDFVIFYGDYVCKSPGSTKIKNEFVSCFFEGEISVVRILDKLCLSQVPRKIFLVFSYLACFKGASLFDKIFLGLACARTRIDIERFERKNNFNKKTRNIITFCDAIGVENMISQLAKHHGLVTYTLQHGQYRNLDELNMSQDIEALFNFVSDFMFCWGQATAEEFSRIGVSPNRMLSVGRLGDREGDGREIEFSIRKGEVFGVVLSGENSRSYNFSLIRFCNELAEVTDTSYVTRLHPSNKWADYSACVSNRGREEKSEDYFGYVKFSVMGMTGFFMDCIENCHPFFFYNNGRISNVFLKSGHQLTDSSLSNNEFSQIYNFKELELYFNDCAEQKLKIRRALGYVS